MKGQLLETRAFCSLFLLHYQLKEERRGKKEEPKMLFDHIDERMAG